MGGTNNSNRKFTCGQYPTVNGFHVSSWDGSSLISCCRIDDALPSYQWTHICYSYRKGSIKIYINGVLRATTSLTMANSSYAAETQVLWNYNGRRIQDVRIYDHALSAKEVKELSQGLIAHYPMGGVGDTCPNIATGSWSVMTARSMGQYYDRLVYDTGFFGLSAGDTYTYSVKLTAPEGRPLRTRLQFYNTDSDRPNLYGTIVPAGTTGYSVLTDTLTATQRAYARMELLIQNVDTSQSTSVTYYAGDLKLERGGVATPWVPHSSSTAYTVLGLNSTKLADVTGHGHDLTWSTLPTVVSGSPRHMTASDFNAAAYASRSSCGVVVPAYTVAFWVRPIANTNQHFIYGGFDDWTHNGMGIYRNANTSKYTVISTSSAESSYGYVYVTATLNTWNHIAITWTGTTLTAYLNGAVAETKTYGSSGTCTFPVIYLGNSMYSGTPASETEECAMSDFRMYATALTADQVKELYSAPVSIANNGTLVAGEFVESATAISVNKNGVLSASSFASIPAIFGKEIRIEPDGSAWLKIVHHADAGSYKFASSDPFATGVYTDSRRWFMGHVCSSVDKWELMVELRANSTVSTYKYRWVQQYDPNVATFANVAAANVTKYTTSQGYNTINSSYGGIYKKNSNTYYSANDGNSGDWWGAIGSWASVTGGIPAYNGVVVGDGGYEDLWLRVDNVTWNTAVDRVSFDRGGAGIRAVDLLET